MTFLPLTSNKSGRRTAHPGRFSSLLTGGRLKRGIAHRTLDVVLLFGDRFGLVLTAISLLFSIGLWVWGYSPTPARLHGAYAVLAYSDNVPDREIIQSLENEGFSGLISESGQWVYLDSFGSIEQIPLDEINTRILPIDPRNDGYAAKLRSLFAMDGKRMVFIPVNYTEPRYHRNLSAAMGDIPYTLEYARIEKTDKVPAGLLLVLFCLASAAFYFVRPLRSALRLHAGILLPCLPVLAPLSLGGAGGFALAALLAGFAVFLTGSRFDRFSPSGQRYMSRRFLLPVFLVFYCLIAFLSSLPVIFSFLVLALFCGVFTASFQYASRTTYGTASFDSHSDTAHAEKNYRPPKSPLMFMRQHRIPGHQRFTPVMIINRRTYNFGFSLIMIPYTVAAILLALTVAALPREPGDGYLDGYQAASADFTFLPASTLSEEDFQNHFLFQSTFSQRSLFFTPNFNSFNRDDIPDMGDFRLAPDGLPEPSVDTSPAEGSLLETIPPFPLGSFLQELEKIGNHTVEDKPQRKSPLLEILLALLPLSLIIPGLFRRKNHRPLS